MNHPDFKKTIFRKKLSSIVPKELTAGSLKKTNACLIAALLVSMLVVFPARAQVVENPFLIHFKNKTAVIPHYRDIQKPAAAPTVTVAVSANRVVAPVSPYIYGTNASYVLNIDKSKKLLSYLNLLSPNIIRLPGGSGSDLFFWDASPGHLPPGVPDSIWIGRNKKWKKRFPIYGHGGRTFPLDGYYQMLKRTHSTGIITVNYAYARYGKTQHPIQQAAHYAADWVRYDHGRTKYWEIGNEDYGKWEAGYLINTRTNKDGQPRIDSGRNYGRIARVFIDSMRVAAKDVGAKIYIGTQIFVQPPRKYDDTGKTWNSGYFQSAGNIADFYIQHNYFGKYKKDEAPIPILNSVQEDFSKVDHYFPKEIEALGGKPKAIAMTEWNIRANGSRQTTSYISGMHAAMVLGALAERPFYGEASRWLIANRPRGKYVLSMFKGLKDNKYPVGVPKWNPFPSFFYLYYFQRVFGDHVLHSAVQGSNHVLAYASSFGSGQLGIVVVNRGSSQQTIEIKTAHFTPGKRYYIYTLTGGSDNSPFSQQVFVNGAGPDYSVGGPINELKEIRALSAPVKGGIRFDSPAMSVQYLLIQGAKGGHSK